MTKKRIDPRQFRSEFNSSKMLSVEDLQTVTDILAKLDTQVKSLNKAFSKVEDILMYHKADALDVKNNIDSVNNYINWIGLKLIHNIPTEETPLKLSAEEAEEGQDQHHIIKLTIESEKN